MPLPKLSVEARTSFRILQVSKQVVKSLFSEPNLNWFGISSNFRIFMIFSIFQLSKIICMMLPSSNGYTNKER